MRKFIYILLIIIFTLSSCSDSKELQDDSNSLNIRISGTVTEGDESKITALSDIVGFDLNYTTGSGVDAQKIYLEISNQEQYELFKTSPLVFSNMHSSRQTLNITPYLQQYAPNLYNSIDNWGICTDPTTGDIYCIPDYYDNEVASNVIYYNNNSLDFDNEIITLEEFSDSICSSTEIKFPYYTNHASVYYDYVIRQSFKVGSDWNYKNNEYIHISSDENYYEYLSYMSELYSCGALGDYQLTSDNEQFSSLNDADSIATTTNYYNSTEFDFTPNVIVALSNDDEYIVDNNSQSLNAVSFIPVYMDEYAPEILTKLNNFYVYDSLEEIYKQEKFTNFDTISYMPANPTNYIDNESINNEKLYVDQEIYNTIEQYTPEDNEIDQLVYSKTYFEQQKCISTTMIVFSNNYILGESSNSTKDELVNDLNETCNLDSVTEQINKEIKLKEENYD